MNKFITYILLFILFTMLILVRTYENDLFYDPYSNFFESDYLYKDSPRPDLFNLILQTIWRYIINTVISLGILYLFFKDMNIVKFSLAAYIIALIILMSFYIYLVMHPKQEDYYIFFTIRRFLIQPIILLLLLPAFYYYKLKNGC